MRYGQILSILHDAKQPVTMNKLQMVCSTSERSIRSDIRVLKQDSQKNGFEIRTFRNQGYLLIIHDSERFQAYFSSLKNISLNANESNLRIINLKLTLLLADNFLTINQLADLQNVSVATIKKDLKQVKPFFETNQLNLVGKPYYGIRIEGSESTKRTVIISLLRNQLPTPVMTSEYQQYLSSFDTTGLRFFLEDTLKKQSVEINDLLLKNLIEHIRLLIFRLKRHNYILSPINGEKIAFDSKTDDLLFIICNYITKTYQVVMPPLERDYLRIQIAGKLSYVQSVDRNQYVALIMSALKKIDKSYDTNFEQDEELQDSLLLHIVPLFKRLSTNHQLVNPLIDDIYTRYANVINVTIDFINYIADNSKYHISKDELGYLAIYFAASLEKQKNKEIETYRHVVILSQNGGGAAYLLKTNLRRLFLKAQVDSLAINQIDQIDETVDLVLSTVPLNSKPFKAPMIQIDQLISSQTLPQIEQDIAMLHERPNIEISVNQQILNLFSQEHFRIKKANDYLSELKCNAEKLERDGFAQQGFSDSLLERETKINTIYGSGVAGPHAMESFANIECIDITILKEPLLYSNRSVRIIFLINLAKGHLILHQEISRLLIGFMNDPDLEKRLMHIRDFVDMSQYIQTILKRG